MHAPMWHDADLGSVWVRCHKEASKSDPEHVSCAPKTYVSPLYWDGVDSIVFRPVSEALGVVTSGEAVDVNSFDEVPDSAWFTNRIGLGWLTVEQLRLGACKPDQLLDPDHAPDGSWVIDKGKEEGSTGGFRIEVAGHGKYMVKLEDKDDHPERQSAASVVGAAIYAAAGYNTACEQVLYIRPSVLRLRPGLVARGNFSDPKPFDKAALDRLLAQSVHRGDLVRVSASAWIPGHIIGPLRYEGTREDDPNDVVLHENRRELRALRVLASWIDRFDSREENSLDTWMADDRRRPESSPGHIVHYQLDLSETLGGDWSAIGFVETSKRLGRSYIFDWSDFGQDLLSLGAPLRPWDRVHTTPGHELFGYYDVASFHPDQWKNEYPNPAFTRMTERDAAWMARIMARFTPDDIRALAEMGRFTDARNTAYLANVLEGRLARILDRYLLRLSPLSDVHLDADGNLCALDLAAARGVRDPSVFHFSAGTLSGRPLSVEGKPGGDVCIRLAHETPYVVVAIGDGVARGKLLVHLYDLGSRGFKIAGVERPAP